MKNKQKLLVRERKQSVVEEQTHLVGISFVSNYQIILIKVPKPKIHKNTQHVLKVNPLSSIASKSLGVSSDRQTNNSQKDNMSPPYKWVETKLKGQNLYFPNHRLGAKQIFCSQNSNLVSGNNKQNVIHHKYFNIHEPLSYKSWMAMVYCKKTKYLYL